ncbi:MAG: ThiF family adenylyltransferase [Verrucomicrobia bacterium]|nr:ThiF family adenylyltransferase [Verrucomicrobiota bacterium]
MGFVHSHPPGFRRLSGPDEDYATKILAAFKSLDRLCLPLAMTIPDCGQFDLLPFVAIPDAKNRKNVTFEVAELAIEAESAVLASASSITSVHGGSGDRTSSAAAEKPTTTTAAQPDEGASPTASVNEADAAGLTTWRYCGDFPSAWREADLRKRGQNPKDQVEPVERQRELEQSAIARQQSERHFERVKTAVNVRLLDGTRLVVIGNGGAASLIRDCARCAFGEFVLVDPDHISEPNIGSQSADPAKLGTAKAEALAQEIRAINPASAVVAMRCRIEEITDQDFEILIRAPLRYHNDPLSARVFGTNPLGHPSQPARVILMGLTDNFYAQARAHRLGLQYGLPTICAQEYAEGRGAEITWTVPGVTAACHRCLTASRYQAYEEGYNNTVTSNGAPIFAAQMLNAALGQITLAVAHHSSRHVRYGNWVSRMGNRNLQLIRMDPDFDQFMGRPVFGRRLAGAAEPGAFLMMDSLFVAQTPDSGQADTRPVCPDCGGVGDLREVIGTFADTRPMRHAEKQQRKT